MGSGGSGPGSGSPRWWPAGSRRPGGWPSCPTGARWSPNATAAGSSSPARPAAAGGRDRARGGRRRRGRPARAGGLARLSRGTARLRLLHRRQDNRIVRFRLGGGAARGARRPASPRPASTTAGGSPSGPTACCTPAPATPATRAGAQDPASLGGKILRLTPDGEPAPATRSRTRRVQLGHRNVQGLAWDDAGRLFATEFGQNTVDEVNLIEPGGNYGWPEVEGTGRRGAGSATRWSPGRRARRPPAAPRSPAPPCTWPRSAANGCGRCRSTATATGAPAAVLAGPTAACARSRWRPTARCGY